MRSLDEVLIDLKKAEKEFADKLEEFEAKQKAYEEAQSLNKDNEVKEDKSGNYFLFCEIVDLFKFLIEKS